MTWRNGRDVTKPKLERRCPEAKICPKCGRPLLRKNFYFSLRSKDYLSTLCRECLREKNREEQKERKERVVEWLKENRKL